MLIESVINRAKPLLEGVKIRDAVIGISLIGIELDNRNIGVTYVLRESLLAGCSRFPFGQEVVGKDAAEIAEWAVSGADDLQRGIGVAVLCAASRSLNLTDCETPQSPFGIEVRETDTVGLVGHIPPVVKRIGPQVKDMHIFDEGLLKTGAGEGLRILPMTEQSRILPTCDIVVFSGTTFINGSIDVLLEMSSNAREVLILGPSTPMFPEAFRDSKISVLAGSWWQEEEKENIFKRISLACGVSHIREFAIQKTVSVQ